MIFFMFLLNLKQKVIIDPFNLYNEYIYMANPDEDSEDDSFLEDFNFDFNRGDPIVD